MADLPKPHQKKKQTDEVYHPYDELRREDAIRRAKAAKEAAAANRPKPKGKARFSADTETLRVPPELYEDTVPGEDEGFGDGYDPYEQPLPRKRKPRQPQDAYRPPRATYYDDMPQRPKKAKK